VNLRVKIFRTSIPADKSTWEYFSLMALLGMKWNSVSIFTVILKTLQKQSTWRI
jgi:hypothetical protein